MKKSDWQYLVDTLLFICMFGIALIGILLGFFIAQGPTVRESEKYLLGLHRHQWGDIHLYLSLAFILLVTIHLILSWSWIKGKSQALFKKRWRTVILLPVLGSVLLLFVFWISTPKYPFLYESYGKRASHRSGTDFSPTDSIHEAQGYVTITGNMTLAEVEKITGIPPKSLVQELGLPAKIASDETLGQLRKKYGFSVIDVRETITALLQSVQEEPYKPSDPEESQNESPFRTQEKSEKHEEEPKLTRGKLSEDQSGILITGRMTFYDIEKQTGLSARSIANTIGLPQNAPMDLSLGHLRRQYGFNMQEVRDAVSALLDKK